MIDHVIVVAGASCAGKTTFLNEVWKSGGSVLPAELRAIDFSDYAIVNAMDLMSSSTTSDRPRRIILHYDIFRPVTFYGVLSFDVDPALDLVRRARTKHVLTLWDDPNLLLDRSERRRRNLWRKLVRLSSIRNLRANVDSFRGAKVRRDRMRPWFANRNRLWQLYEAWFRAIGDAGLERHWIAKPSEGISFAPMDEICPAPLWPISYGVASAGGSENRVCGTARQV